MTDELGITVKKADDANAWYTDVINKGQLIEYTDVSGCYILKPRAQFIWDVVRDFIDERIAARGVRNASFPLFIPERLLLKEQQHVEGFAPEVAWVTQTGETPLAERLAVRPTSETIMYAAYAKWIRTHRDLPLKRNQWCNVIRWEFNHPQPFLRSREFLWQEGHSAFATEEDARAEANDILVNVYRAAYEELLAVPVVIGSKTEREKFAGAVQSLSCEVLLPLGKAVQGCTSHYLGTNFARAFGIQFQASDESLQYVHQNSWGFSTRSIGIAVMMHSDDKGLVLPPRAAEHQVCIIPVLRKGDAAPMIDAAYELAQELRGVRVSVDDREHYTLGWRINDAELAGYPLRIEFGPREIAAGTVTLVPRDTLEKKTVPRENLLHSVTHELHAMHERLYAKAAKNLHDARVESQDLGEIQAAVDAGKMVKVAYHYGAATDDLVRQKTAGKTLCVPLGEDAPQGCTCPFSGNAATAWVYIAKSL
jgi:prolyl-tRNA synthetase